MYLKLLEQLEKKRKSYGLGMQPPANENELINFKQQVTKRLQHKIDKEYLNFLSIRNGFSWNGFSIYATCTTPIIGYSDRFIDGFVDVNLSYWEIDDNMIFITFGESGDTRYVFNLSKMRFEEIDKIALDTITIFNSFEELVYKLLQNSL